MTKCLYRIVLLLVLTLASSVTLYAGEDRYAAIAFSPSTGRYGYGNKATTKSAAIERALKECGEHDAITKWCKNQWIALAVTPRTRTGYGWGTGARLTAGEARSVAVDMCLKYNEEAKVLVCVSASR